MHELSIVKHIMKSIEEVAEEEGVTRIGSVTLEVGEVSGIVIEQIKDCWLYFREKVPMFTEAELKVIETPAVTWCDGCKRTYETVKYGKICPYCSSPRTWLIEGNDCSIKEIEAETAAPPHPPEV
ncbi:MAG: hydrogenase maturation nickel metallochaperone HypA [Firmicutes bacterium]|nr:hydrogenase maturation nickel metallochaperone HypA [Bacillota bacterium]